MSCLLQRGRVGCQDEDVDEEERTETDQHPEDPGPEDEREVLQSLTKRVAILHLNSRLLVEVLGRAGNLLLRILHGLGFLQLGLGFLDDTGRIM